MLTYGRGSSSNRLQAEHDRWEQSIVTVIGDYWQWPLGTWLVLFFPWLMSPVSWPLVRA